MISTDSLTQWLTTLPRDSAVAIDDGGLALLAIAHDGTLLDTEYEVGGLPDQGTVVVGERDHEPFAVNGENYFVRELLWNGTTARSYDLVRAADDLVLTEDESFDNYPSDAQIAAVLATHDVQADLAVLPPAESCMPPRTATDRAETTSW